MIEMEGGRSRIFKDSDTVIRPANYWTKTVHRFLQYCHENGADFVPYPVDLSEKTEKVSFVQGEVYNDPYPDIVWQEETLKSASRLLKQFHSVSQGYLLQMSGDDEWMLEPQDNAEIICHGDYAPYNVTLVNGVAAGIIDFDTIHPAPVMWDICYAVYRWVPLTTQPNPDCEFSLKDQVIRAKAFLDEYGLDAKDRKALVPTLIRRLETLVNYMITNSSSEDMNFAEDIKDGHLKIYRNDVQYLIQHQEEITNGIQ